MSSCATLLFVVLLIPLALHGQSVVELTRDVLVDYSYKPDVPLADGSPFRTLNERAFEDLADIAGSSDIAVEVQAESRRCAFTADETFINSDWSFRVLEVFQNNSAGTVAHGGLITVTRPGGELDVRGVRYVATDRNFDDYIAGKTYLLFLRSAYGSSGDQRAAYVGSAAGSFLVTDQRVVYLDDIRHHGDLRAWLRGASVADAIKLIASSSSVKR